MEKPTKEQVERIIKSLKIGRFLYKIQDRVIIILLIVTAITSAFTGETFEDGLMKLLFGFFLFWLNSKILNFLENQIELLNEYKDKNFPEKKSPDQ